MMKEVADRFGAEKLGLVYTGAEKKHLTWQQTISFLL